MLWCHNNLKSSINHPFSCRHSHRDLFLPLISVWSLWVVNNCQLCQVIIYPFPFSKKHWSLWLLYTSEFPRLLSLVFNISTYDCREVKSVAYLLQRHTKCHEREIFFVRATKAFRSLVLNSSFVWVRKKEWTNVSGLIPLLKAVITKISQ